MDTYYRIYLLKQRIVTLQERNVELKAKIRKAKDDISSISSVRFRIRTRKDSFEWIVACENASLGHLASRSQLRVAHGHSDEMTFALVGACQRRGRTADAFCCMDAEFARALRICEEKIAANNTKIAQNNNKVEALRLEIQTLRRTL
jgi:chromosome segregation ATPase